MKFRIFRHVFQSCHKYFIHCSIESLWCSMYRRMEHKELKCHCGHISLRGIQIKGWGGRQEENWHWREVLTGMKSRGVANGATLDNKPKQTGREGPWEQHMVMLPPCLRLEQQKPSWSMDSLPDTRTCSKSTVTQTAWDEHQDGGGRGNQQDRLENPHISLHWRPHGFCQRSKTEEKVLSLTNGAGETGYTKAQECSQAFAVRHPQNLTQSLRPRGEIKSYKTLSRSHSRKISMSLAWAMVSWIWQQKQNKQKINLIKNVHFCASKYTITRETKQCTEGERISANHMRKNVTSS